MRQLRITTVGRWTEVVSTSLRTPEGNNVMLCLEIVAICSGNQTEDTNILCEQNVEF